jgi:hypothetical protein
VRLVRIACFLGLAALALMAWSVVQPTVWPVLIALSLGQLLGTLSLGLYVITIIRDLDIRRHLRR